MSSLAYCIRTILLDPDDLALVRKHVEMAGNEEAGVRAFLAELQGELEGLRQQLVAQGFDAVEQKAAPQKSAPRARERTSPSSDQIEDFGEKIHGARKDMVTEYVKTLGEEANVAVEPLSKTFPPPNYAKLVESGVSKRALAYVALFRNEIPSRPKLPGRARNWAEKVKLLRGFAHNLLSDETYLPKLEEKLAGEYASLRSLVNMARVMEGMDPEMFPFAAQWNVAGSQVSMLNGERFSPAKFLYILNDHRNRWTNVHGEKVDDVLDPARALIKESYDRENASGNGRRTPLSLYNDRKAQTVWIGFKGLGNTVIRLKTGFADVKAARLYIQEHADDLQKQIDEMREGPVLRRAANMPRVGAQRRDGDVTPQIFSETFGFRGVQFGNYVEGDRRQSDLNESFDALMDLADVLDIPPRALSLNGRLGLAFGARGHGGRNAAAAHYEPGQVVINLTKHGGPGSLAHEWLHALDNYFGKQSDGGYVSEGRRPGDVREAVFAAWKGIEAVLKTGDFAKRSLELDEARSKPYFSTTIEKAARSFERYVVDRMEAKGESNDYLANINKDGGAYPTDSEMSGQGIREAWDNLFNTIETVKDEATGNMVMGTAASGPAVTSQQFAAAEETLERLALKLLKRKVQVDLVKAMPRGMPAAFMAAYDSRTQSIIVSMRAAYDLATVVGHEALHALRDMGAINAAEWGSLVAQARKLGYADELEKNHGALYRKEYGEQWGLKGAALEDKMNEEAVAYMMGDYVNAKEKMTTFAQKVIDRLKEWARAVLEVLRSDGVDAERVMADIYSGRMADRLASPESQVETAEEAVPAAMAEMSPPSNYTPLHRFVWRSATTLGRDARDYVLKHGAQLNAEVLLALDGNGNILSDGHGPSGERTVGVSAEHAVAQERQGKSIVTHHSHPSTASLSVADIAMLAHPGAGAVWAHTSAGSYRATLHDGLRDLGFRRLRNALKPILIWLTPVREVLQVQVDKGVLTPEQAQLDLVHLRNEALHLAGVIHYYTNVRYASYEGLDSALDESVAAIREGLANADIDIRGHARPVRHLGDMGILPEGFGRSGGRGVSGSADQGSGRGDRGPQSGPEAGSDQDGLISDEAALDLHRRADTVRHLGDMGILPEGFGRPAESGAAGVADPRGRQGNRGYENGPKAVFGQGRVKGITPAQRRRAERNALPFQRLLETIGQGFGFKIVDTGLPFGYTDRWGKFWSFGTQIIDKAIPGDKIGKWMDSGWKASPELRAYIKEHMTARWAHRVWFGHDPLANLPAFIDKFGVAALPEWGVQLFKDSLTKAGIPLPGTQWLVQSGLVGDRFATAWLSMNIGEALSGGLSILGTYRLIKQVKNGEPVHKGWAVAGILFKLVGGTLSANPVVLLSAAADAAILVKATTGGVRDGLQQMERWKKGRMPMAGSEDSPRFMGMAPDDGGRRAGEYRPVLNTNFVAPSEDAREVWNDLSLPMLQRLSRSADALSTRPRRLLQDRFIDVKRFQKAIAEGNGEAIAEVQDAYMRESLYYGRAGQRLEDFRLDRIEPLLDRVARAGLSLEDVDEYLYARHAKERNARIAEVRDDMPEAGSGMTDDEAQDVLDKWSYDHRAAELGVIGDAIDQLVRETRETLRNGGLISQDTFQKWTDQYQHYVPLRGFEDTVGESEFRPNVGSRFDVRGDEAKKALGRRSKADSPLAYVVAQAQQAIVRAEKNRVGQTFLRLAMSNPNPEVWSVEQPKAEVGADPVDGFEREQMPKGFVLAENVLSVKVRGQEYRVELRHAGLASAMKGMGSAQLGAVGRLFAGFNRYLSLINTQLSADFIFSNFARDVQTGLANLSEENIRGLRRRVVKDIFPAIAGGFRAMRGNVDTPWAENFRDYADAGGRISFFEMKDIEGHKRDLERYMKAMRGGTWQTGINVLRGLGDLISDTNGAVENGIRLAAYKNLRDAGVSRDRAAFVARELTVNFNRKGDWGQVMNAFYLFFNANLQGSVRMLQAVAGNRRVQMVAAGIIIAGFVVDSLNRALSDDDDDDGMSLYDKISEDEKQRKMILFLPGMKEPFHLPLPYGYSVFYTMGRKMSAVYHGADDTANALADVGTVAINSFNPIGNGGSLLSVLAPTVMDPFVDIYTNLNWAGKPLRPNDFPGQERKPDSQKFWPSAQEWSKTAADVMNKATGGNEVRPGAVDISPSTIDYVVRFLGGAASTTVLRFLDAPWKAWKGEEIEASDVPLLRVVYGANLRFNDRQTFYQIADEVKLVEQEEKLFGEGKDKAALKDLRRSKAVELKAVGWLKDAEKQLRVLRKEKKTVAASDMDSRQQQEKINDIEERIDKVMAGFRKRYYALKKQAKD